MLKSPIAGRVLYRLAEPGEVLAAGGKVLTVLELTDVYMTIFLPTALAGRIAVGSEARIVLDAVPQYVIPATISFVAARAQFTPKDVETRTEREKLMFRIKVRIDPELLGQVSRPGQDRFARRRVCTPQCQRRMARTVAGEAAEIGRHENKLRMDN